jgi:hypothetical protein
VSSCAGPACSGAHLAACAAQRVRRNTGVDRESCCTCACLASWPDLCLCGLVVEVCGRVHLLHCFCVLAAPDSLWSHSPCALSFVQGLPSLSELDLPRLDYCYTFKLQQSGLAALRLPALRHSAELWIEVRPVRLPAASAASDASAVSLIQPSHSFLRPARGHDSASSPCAFPRTLCSRGCPPMPVSVP